MLEAELAHRDATKRARLLRQARLPVHKSAEGFDWSHVRFSEGWGRDDMLFVASKMLTKRHVAFEHFGRHVLHCFFALPSIKAASMRWLAPLNSTSLPWWTILSIMADASLSSPRTVPHFENSMFVVNIMLRLS